MEKAGVPVVPGYHGADQDDGALAAAAERDRLSGAAQGLGRRRRQGHAPRRQAGRIRRGAWPRPGARRSPPSATTACWWRNICCGPRHVEVQVFADSHGHVLHLFERDCSIQRRHQKVIEEAPAPGLAAALRQPHGRGGGRGGRAPSAMSAPAPSSSSSIARASSIFMEMNTRLQVEHPVTEMITGLDLVRMAAPRRLGRSLCRSTQARGRGRGHAFEARLYAEDPARDFLPATGRLVHFALPAPDGHVRVDTGVRAGRRDLDPLRSDDRQADRLGRGSRAGPPASCGGARPGGDRRARQQRRLPARRWPAIRPLPPARSIPASSSAITTRSSRRQRPTGDGILAAAVASLLLGQEDEARQAAAASADPHSPWHAMDGWRLNLDARQDFRFLRGWRRAGCRRCITAAAARAGFRRRPQAGRVHRRRRRPPSHRPWTAMRFEATVVRQGQSLHHLLPMAQPDRLDLIDPLAAAEAIEAPLGPADGADARADRRSSM